MATLNKFAGWNREAIPPLNRQMKGMAYGETLRGSAVLYKGAVMRGTRRLSFRRKPEFRRRVEVEALRWLNVVLSNLKTALSGTHHAFKFAKYAARYLAQAQYRFNCRSDLAAMVPRLAVAVMQTKPCPGRLIVCPAEVKT